MTELRAALNLAVQNRRVGADRAIESTLLRQHSHAEGRRRLFLDLEQRRRHHRCRAVQTRAIVSFLGSLTGRLPADFVAAPVRRWGLIRSRTEISLRAGRGSTSFAANQEPSPRRAVAIRRDWERAFGRLFGSRISAKSSST